MQLEIGQAATAFERLNFNEQLNNCLPFYEKSFNYAVAPAQNAGSDIGDYRIALGVAGFMK